MAVCIVFSECVRYYYKSTLCSKATLLIILTSIFTVLPPLLIAYRSRGFWMKSEFYQEQPDVHFKHEYFLLVDTDNIEIPIVCTTYEQFKQGSQCAMIKSREEDYNKDGKYDQLSIEIHVQAQDLVVRGVTLLLVFDYKLYTMTFFEMESIGYVQHSSSVPGARLDIVADLRLNQKQLLGAHGRDSRFQKTVMSSNSLKTIIEEYGKRNLSTVLKNIYPLWTAGRPPFRPFVVSANIFYPEDTILYKPDFWQMIKWAWMQYLSILIIFVWLFRFVKSFIFRNQLVSSIKQEPWKKIY